ncbi:hypothetical protein CRE_06879 [Caenorhabditis remanei]|uniref:BTB domain-containing protein n=1 Tax=Caenorhabditis remanei TaxID=31234 RepID=E3MZP4_CAERE|nr:hypothetical protein CRE_06879 [Caenorhabditis remanei]
MITDIIGYESKLKQVATNTNVLEKSVNKGITCVWSGTMNSYYDINFTWKFDWSELKNQGIDEITGHITVKSSNNYFEDTKVNVKVTKNDQIIKKQIRIRYNYDYVSYQYSLTPHFRQYKHILTPSELNDKILVVDKRKVFVNKTFLSYHSEYFRALFSSNFKEGQMDEIPIREVSFEDFALLLCTFYLNPVLPTDETVEKLLEMASRFMVSSVINIIEYHLMNNTKINSDKMLWMADEYVMPKLLEKCIRELNSMEKAQKLEKSPEYEKLSDSAKAKALDRLIKLF